MRIGSTKLLTGAVFLAILCGTASAGTGNTLYLTQDSDAYAGNSFLSDQSAGSYTSIGSEYAPALQSGSLNSAVLTLKGDCASGPSTCGTLEFRQDNSTVGLSNAAVTVGLIQGNTASVMITGTGNGRVTQIGDDNTVDLRLDTGNGSIEQTGVFNVAKLQIIGAVTGSISQTGNSNIGNMEISGIPGSSVALTQTGNGLGYSGPYAGDVSTPPMTVFTTGSISITQTGF